MHSAFSALFMQHYGVNNTIQNNVFAHSVGSCQSFDPSGPPAPSSDRPGDPELLEHCAGYLWDPAYRGQQCSYTFTKNLVAISG